MIDSLVIELNCIALPVINRTLRFGLIIGWHGNGYIKHCPLWLKPIGATSAHTATENGSRDGPSPPVRQRGAYCAAPLKRCAERVVKLHWDTRLNWDTLDGVWCPLPKHLATLLPPQQWPLQWPLAVWQIELLNCFRTFRRLSVYWALVHGHSCCLRLRQCSDSLN